MPDGQALAISRPFEITRGQRTRKTLEKPDAGTDVFVVISRDVMDPEESLCLVSDSSTREADVIIRTGLRVYGVWYSQHGKRATLQFKSRYAVLPPTELRLTPASVVTFRANAQEVPGRNVGKD